MSSNNCSQNAPVYLWGESLREATLSGVFGAPRKSLEMMVGSECSDLMEEEFRRNGWDVRLIPANTGTIVLAQKHV